MVRVYKVGGDSTGIYNNLVALGDFVKFEYNSRHNLVIVVSAQASEKFRTTEALRAMHKMQERDWLDGIIKQHNNIAKQAGIEFDVRELERLVEQARTLPEMEGIGEKINAPFVAKYFRKNGINAEYASALDLLHEKNGRVDFAGKIEGRVIVTEGFIYTKEDGSIGTFPTGGSEVSGDLFAEGLNAELYGVIKNNPWFCTADPKVVNGALRVEELTFRELAEMAYAGARAMNERGMIRSAKSDRPIMIGSAQDFMQHATIIRRRRNNLVQRPYAGIASKEGFVVYHLEAKQEELLPIFLDFSEANVSVDMVSTNGEISIAIYNQEKITSELENKIKARTNLFRKEENMSLVSVVGENMPPAAEFSQHLANLVHNSGFEKPKIYGAMPLPAGVGVLEIEQIGMNSQRGYLAKVLSCLQRNGLPVTGILTTVDSIGLQFPREYRKELANSINMIEDELTPDLINFTRTNLGIEASPKRTTNITLAIPEENENQVVRLLHRNLFPK